MQILITDTFKDDFCKIFNSEFLIKDFSLIIKKKSHTVIDLRFPNSKLKIKYIWINLRLIIYIWFEDTFVPIFIIKKWNKKLWMNLVLDKRMDKILDKKFQFSLNDINNDNYKMY